MATAIAPTPLSASDRCDRCGARAYVRVVLPKGGELLFCAHHGRRHESALRAGHAEITDETHVLEETPASAPPDER